MTFILLSFNSLDVIISSSSGAAATARGPNPFEAGIGSGSGYLSAGDWVGPTTPSSDPTGSRPRRTDWGLRNERCSVSCRKPANGGTAPRWGRARDPGGAGPSM